MNRRKFFIVSLYMGIFGTLFFIVFHLYAGQQKNITQSFPETKLIESLKATYVELGGTKITVEVADTDALRKQGLSGREGLRENHGMLFLFPVRDRYAFWMKDMRFSIDMVWIAKGVVASVNENALPEPGVDLSHLKLYIPDVPVDTVIELPSGFVHTHHINLGTPVYFVRQ